MTEASDKGTLDLVKAEIKSSLIKTVGLSASAAIVAGALALKGVLGPAVEAWTSASHLVPGWAILGSSVLIGGICIWTGVIKLRQWRYRRRLFDREWDQANDEERRRITIADDAKERQRSILTPIIDKLVLIAHPEWYVNLDAAIRRGVQAYGANSDAKRLHLGALNAMQQWWNTVRPLIQNAVNTREEDDIKNALESLAVFSQQVYVQFRYNVNHDFDQRLRDLDTIIRPKQEQKVFDCRWQAKFLPAAPPAFYS
jgi:hypothetical protein